MRRLESAGATPAVGANVVARSGDTARDAKVGRISAEVEKAAALRRKNTIKYQHNLQQPGQISTNGTVRPVDSIVNIWYRLATDSTMAVSSAPRLAIDRILSA